MTNLKPEATAAGPTPRPVALEPKPSPCPRCGEVADLGACSSGACRNCGFRPSCSMG